MLVRISRFILVGIYFLFALATTFGQKKVIAIIPFEVPHDMEYRYDFNGTGLLEKIPTLLEGELYRTGIFDIVERARLDALLDEKTLSYAGVTDKEFDYSAFKGVDYFLFGKISGFSSDYDNIQIHVGSRTMYVNRQSVDITLTIKLVDVNTGKLIHVITEEAEANIRGIPRGNRKSGVSNRLVDKAAKKVIKKIAERIKDEL